MKKIEEYTPYELAEFAANLGGIISKNLDANSQNVLGHFINGIGQSVLIMSAQTKNLKNQEKNEPGDDENTLL